MVELTSLQIYKQNYNRRPEVKLKKQQYGQRPDVKLRKKEYGKKYWNQQEVKQRQKERSITLRAIIINHYSSGKRECACCGESILRFLTIDHINNDGNEQRKKIHPGGSRFYSWIINNNFPDGFQVLCLNCNLGKSHNNGVCIHKELKDDSSWEHEL